MSSFSGTTTWIAFKDVFQAQGRSDLHQQIHRRICADFPHDQQIRDSNGFRRLLCELLEGEPPLSGSRPAETEHQSAPDIREPVPSPSSTKVPRRQHQSMEVPGPSRQRNAVHPPAPQRHRAPSPPRTSTNVHVPVPPPHQIPVVPTPPPQTTAEHALPPRNPKPPMWRRLFRFFDTRPQRA